MSERHHLAVELSQDPLVLHLELEAHLVAKPELQFRVRLRGTSNPLKHMLKSRPTASTRSKFS